MVELAATADAASIVLRSESVVRGVQIAVINNGELATTTLGNGALGREMNDRTIWRWACAAKPFVAMGIACLVEQGAIGLENAVGEYVRDFRGGQKDGITIGELLDHTAHLERPSMQNMIFALMSRSDRHGAICSMPTREPERRRQTAAYSDYASWHLLGYVIETVSGQDLRTFMYDKVISKLECDQIMFQMSTLEFARARENIGIHAVRWKNKDVPFLMDRTEFACRTWDPTFAWYGSAAGLAQFYWAVLRSVTGQDNGIWSQEVASTFTGLRRGRLYDRTHRRFCDHSKGFMVELRDYGFGELPSKSAFGHVGYWGGVLGWADPERATAACVIFNGLPNVGGGDVVGLGEETVRSAIVRAIYDDIGATTG